MTGRRLPTYDELADWLLAQPLSGRRQSFEVREAHRRYVNNTLRDEFEAIAGLLRAYWRHEARKRKRRT